MDELGLVNEELVKRVMQVKELKAENERLREALAMLYDCQNGPPLIRDRAEWENAMALAGDLLKEGE